MTVDNRRLGRGWSAGQFRTVVAVLAVAVIVGHALSPRVLRGQGQVVGIPEGAVANGRFEETQPGVIEVTFALVSPRPGAIFELELYVSDAGQPFVRATSVTGDIGPGIVAGVAKRMTWRWTNDLEALAPRIDQFRFQVRARSEPVAPVADDEGGINPLVWVGIAAGGAAGAFAAFGGGDDAAAPVDPPVTQQPPCRFTVAPLSATVGAGASTETFSVQLDQSNCSDPSWSATATASWVTLQPPSGSGGGTVTATIESNATPNVSSPSRSETLSIAGTDITLTQSANTCNHVFSGNATSASASGVGRGSSERTLGVNVAGTCDWTGESEVPWITFESHGNTGTVELTGNETLILRFSNNSGDYRRGGVTVAGMFFDFCQEDAGGGGKIDVRITGTCP